MKKKYLITGGTGFIGSALVSKMAKNGHSVRVFDNNSRGCIERLSEIGDHIEIIQGDIRDEKQVIEAAKDIDAVIHLAYVNGTEYFYTKPELVLDVAIKGMMNIIEACKVQQVKEFFLASSSEVYQTPATVPTDETAPLIIPDIHNPRYSYGGGKIFCELMALHYAKDIFDRLCIFRPHNVYGPNMGNEHVIPQFANRMRDLSLAKPSGKLDFSMKGDGKQTRAFCHIDDFTDAVLLIIKSGNNREIYHIGNPEETEIGDLALKIGKILDRDIFISHTEEFQGETKRRCPDISKMQSIGFVPKVSLEQGLLETVNWYLGN